MNDENSVEVVVLNLEPSNATAVLKECTTHDTSPSVESKTFKVHRAGPTNSPTPTEPRNSTMVSPRSTETKPGFFDGSSAGTETSSIEEPLTAHGRTGGLKIDDKANPDVISKIPLMFLSSRLRDQTKEKKVKKAGKGKKQGEGQEIIS